MTLLDGHKGAVLQRDGQTYAIAPHLPCGVVTPDMLRKIADVAEKYGGVLKCTSAQRIAIIGLKKEDLDAVWKDLGGEVPGHLTGNRVRSVRACPGTQFCKRARQDSLAMGLELDKKFHGKKLPGKMKIGVSGCPNDCAETCIKDIGLVGGVRGWRITIGGTGGMSPKLARDLSDREIPTEQATKVVDRLVEFFEKNAREGERLGEVVARVGMGKVKEAAGV